MAFGQMAQAQSENPGGERGRDGAVGIIYWQAPSILNAYLSGGTKDIEAASLVTEPLGLPSFFGIDDTVHDVADLVPVGSGETTVDMGEATFDALLRFNEHDVRLVGVPGAGAYATAADVARLYQGVLQNPGGLWEEGVLADGIGTVRVTDEDPMRMASASRTRGFMTAGDDAMSPRRGFPVDAGPRTFGHDGAGGQVAWADPDTGQSVAFLPSGIDPDIVRLTRRSISVSTRAMRAVRSDDQARPQD